MLGFTENEKRVVWFLCIGFVCGLCVWIYREYIQPLPVDQSGLVKSNSDATEYRGQKSTLPIPEGGKPGGIPQYKLNINNASEQAFIDLPGIGPVTAKRIVEYREKYGLFKNTEDLLQVRGIGPKTFNKFKTFICIDPIKED
jgi:competence ComEA-like helix-hairpin-helix protein